jgi:hypothetical protein
MKVAIVTISTTTTMMVGLSIQEHGLPLVENFQGRAAAPKHGYGMISPSQET